MVRFSANLFSKRCRRLLTLSFLVINSPCSLLGANNLKEDTMPKSREEVPEKDCWNVSALYSDEKAWSSDFLEIRGEGKEPAFPKLKAYQGLLKDPRETSAFFAAYFDLDRRLSKLYTYAHLRSDEDLGNDAFKSNLGRISELFHAFGLATSWVEPEILSLTDTEYQHLVKHPDLKEYKFHLEKIGRLRPHTLNSEQEALVALAGRALGASHRSFGALNNADLTFDPAIDSKGEEHPLSNGSYLSYLRSPDRALRKSAFLNIHAGYEKFANTLCELIQGQVQSHLFTAKARKFDSCLEAALHPHAIDKKVYTNLIAAVRKNLPAMHEYIAFRKEKMGLDKIHIYDLYAPLVQEVDIKMNYRQACDVVADSVAPLGAKYQGVLRKGLVEDRWVDVFENTRKRGGAYSSGCYDSMPYILMNYHGTFGDVTTLAHEAGHSMHSFLSRTNQSYVYSDYPIFVAEVASTFNEQLLLKLMKENAKNDQELAYLINDEIERIRGTIFRQTMFAEFELQIHTWAEEGVPLTPELLKETYLKLNRDYYGPDIVLDEELAIEWARIPHFYYNFYVYQYATGLSAAMALNQKALASEDAKKRYLEFLSSGGSKYPLDLLKKAGVDMQSPEPVDAALNRFKELTSQLKERMNKN